METLPPPTPFDLDAWVARSGAVDLEAVAWEDVARHPLPAGAVRTLRYMQDIESHTIIYLRSLLATRAIDDPEVATFLACWLHEETFHGIALGRFLEAAGHRIDPRPRERSRKSLPKRLEESRHFFFYYRQAEWRLRRPAVARVTRAIVDRFWAPVGSGVQPRADLDFLGRYLFGGSEGRAAARKVDDTIRRLPGFASVKLLEAWIDR